MAQFTKTQPIELNLLVRAAFQYFLINVPVHARCGFTSGRW